MNLNLVHRPLFPQPNLSSEIRILPGVERLLSNLQMKLIKGIYFGISCKYFRILNPLIFKAFVESGGYKICSLISICIQSIYLVN